MCHALAHGHASNMPQLQHAESLLRNNWERPLDIGLINITLRHTVSGMSLKNLLCHMLLRLWCITGGFTKQL